jgi:CheY-like chemotaxis protein
MAKKIIAVEDSPNLQKILKLIFSETEFEFNLCENYEQLSQLYRLSDFHLLLLDFSISSNIDGYSLCRTIKKDYPTLKVILMFGTFDSPDKDKLNYAGADDHIYKPFDSEKLLKLCQKMTTAIDDQQWAKQSENSKSSRMSEFETTTPEIVFQDSVGHSDDMNSWGNIEVPSIIGGSGSTTPSRFEDFTQYGEINEIHVSSNDVLLERTEVIDLDVKRKNENQNIQKINQIIGKEKIDDLWTFDEESNDRSPRPVKTNSIVDKEHYFENVDQEILKKELMSEFKRTLIYEIKDEVFKQLWNSLKQEFMDKKNVMMDEVAKEVVKEVRAAINERSLKDEIISSIEKNLTSKVKEELPGVLEQTIETLASRVALQALEKKMSSLIPDLAEDLIKKDLASIRKHIM